MHSRIGVLSNWGPLLAHSDNQDFHHFLLFLVSTFTELRAELKRWCTMDRELNLSSPLGKGLQRGDSSASSILEFFEACGSNSAE